MDNLPILADSLTRFANARGVPGKIMIINHTYFLFSEDQRHRIGFTRIQAEVFILRKASMMPLQNIEVETPEKALPGQIDLIVPDGQLSLI